jgi:hypothetical protein
VCLRTKLKDAVSESAISPYRVAPSVGGQWLLLHQMFVVALLFGTF